MTTNTTIQKVSIDPELHHRYELLCSALREYLREGLLIAFSGGVDSAFLVWAADKQRRENGGKLLALTTSSSSLSAAERSDVMTFIRDHQVEHVWCPSHELEREAYLKNDASRCYHCKSELFRICREVAVERGLKTVAYGYNASDAGDTRPGHRAAIENGVVSPLSDSGLKKEDIRNLMRVNGLALADKPASPCLSSRLVTGVAITSEKLRAVDELESMLRNGGLSVFRVRVHEVNGSRFVRLEVSNAEMDLAFALRNEFSGAAKKLGFRWVTLDLEGYKSGGGNAQA